LFIFQLVPIQGVLFGIAFPPSSNSVSHGESCASTPRLVDAGVDRVRREAPFSSRAVVGEKGAVSARAYIRRPRAGAEFTMSEGGDGCVHRVDFNPTST
jgi:hypothetical protein